MDCLQSIVEKYLRLLSRIHDIYACAVNPTMKNICSWSGYLPLQYMCLVRLFAVTIYVPGQAICRYNICAWSGYLPLQYMCLVRLFAVTIYVPGQAICRYNICAWSGYLPLQYTCLVRLFAITVYVPGQAICRSVFQIKSICLYLINEVINIFGYCYYHGSKYETPHT